MEEDEKEMEKEDKSFYNFYFSQQHCFSHINFVCDYKYDIRSTFPNTRKRNRKVKYYGK